MAVAASSPSGRCWNYDVFINFRGEDTRKIFVGHLYRALKQKAIHTFIDSEELRKGNDLSKLLDAIHDSRLSIIVLSKNYASSTWCLIELVEILECMDAQKQIVVPVFYEVDPSDVRKLRGTFAEAFAKHEDGSNANKEEVHSWKTALTRATNLSGWDSRDYKDDSELIEKIVKDTLHKLSQVSSSKPHGLIGMDYHLTEMYSLLDLGVDDVRFVGIWGMGGIGKTTIAKAVYGEIACQFDHSCFLDDVKESFMKKSKAEIREDFLSRILKEKEQGGSNMIMKMLGKKKVLLVLDDLDNIAQFETLLGEQCSFGTGSRIILTTRYIQSLSRVEYRLYKPKCLSYDKAYELFMKYAFKMNTPSGEYDPLTRRAIRYAQGLPLALKVLGASLYNRSVPAWEDTLEKIKETPQKEIQDVLRISFDGLEASEKNIFLDVACFLRGKGKVYATNILKICGFFPDIGLQVLVDKALVTIGYEDRLEMHDLLVELGRNIGRASRLWSYEDYRVLTENTAEAVEAIVLYLGNWNRKEIYWNTEAFLSMKNLRLLKIDQGNSCKQHVTGDLQFLSHQLRLLEWHSCPLKSLPSNFQPLYLVRLSMPRSRIEKLWEGIKPLGNLKSINLSDCHYLRNIPDFSQATNLETLNLSGCTSLVEVHSSISALENLVFWSLKNCKVLESLPSSIHMKSLETLILSGCSNLAKFPEIGGIMKVLCLDETAIEELPSSIENLTGLVTLSLKGCRKLKQLPSSIHMKSLKTLILSGCSNLAKFPEIGGTMKELCLDETAIEELPSSIENLTGLVTLSLKGCRKLKQLPSSIHMKSLKTLILSGCSNLAKFPEIGGTMKELLKLCLDETAIEELPSSIENLTGLVTLSLKGCRKLKQLPSSIHMKSLNTLILSGCSNLAKFPEIGGTMKELCLDETAIEELPSSIENLTGLVTLSLKGCRKLKQLPSSIHMKSLKTLILSGCSNLAKFPEIGGTMKELLKLCLDETAIEELPSSIENLTGLVTLSLKGCRKLKQLPSSICQLKYLKYLILSGCSKFEVCPTTVEGMEDLRELRLDGTYIKELFPSIERLRRLIFFEMRSCRSLICLQDNICNLSYLTGLTLSGCSNLNSLPENFRNSDSLLGLEVEGSGIKQLPSSLLRLNRLETLSCEGSKEVTAPFSSWSSSPSTNHFVVGVVSHIYGMEVLLHLDQVDFVGFVGICGVGGIGKTTIASAVYDKIACLFEYHCFLENVREGFTKKGERQMREELLSRILTEKVQSLGTLNTASNMIIENLSKNKVLLVLDDVDDIAQIEILLGQRYSFGGGSRIIVTTRDKQILSGVNAMTYCPGLLTPKEALVLFCQFAFRTVEPPTEYLRLSQHAIQFAQGLPLALEVLGAFLYNKSLCEWADVLEKFEVSGRMGVQQVLRTSFGGLDNSEKSIFLDVACFFKGMKKDYAISILECCGFFPKVGLRILIDRSLIAISPRDQTLKMHDLVQDMGWEIICQEHMEEPGNRSRLWSYNDVHHVLTLNTATIAVEVITLDLSNSKEVYLTAQAFDKMVKLRLLQILDNGSMDCKQHVNGDFKFLSRELRCLIWHRYPLKSLPSGFHPENLVDLDMCFSRLEQLWEGTKPLRELKFINLSHSPHLEKTFDLTGAPNLKKLILEGCTSLFDVHPSILMHENLVFLNLKGCRELKILPSSMYMKSLRSLDLSGCSNLEKFPEISGIMIELSEINLDETAIKELPSSIERLWGLEVLSVRNCRSLVSLPDSICNLAYLQQLYLAGCSKLYNLPENLRNVQALTILEAQGSGIEQLPFFIVNNKERVREGVTRVSGEGTSSSESGERRDYDNLLSPTPEPQSVRKEKEETMEVAVQVEECSEGGGMLGALCSCLSCLRELFHSER